MARRHITRKIFIAATGREPVNDDLERCNCPLAGQFGHWSCGWNDDADRPQFEVGITPDALRKDHGDD